MFCINSSFGYVTCAVQETLSLTTVLTLISLMDSASHGYPFLDEIWFYNALSFKTFDMVSYSKITQSLARQKESLKVYFTN